MMLSQVAVKLSPVQAVQGSGSSPLADGNAVMKLKGTSVFWEEAQEPPEEHEMAASVLHSGICSISEMPATL